MNLPTQYVGQLQANGFGLYDMSSNVYGWVADRYDRNYFSSSPPVDPPGGSGSLLNPSYRVNRGGRIDNNCAPAFRASDRGVFGAGNAHSTLGFRVARNAE